MDDDDDEISDTYDDNDSIKEYDIIDDTAAYTNNVEDIMSFMNNYETNIKDNKTANILSKYEKTRILCERAQQIEDGSYPYISNIERFNSSYAIALEEFNTKRIPFIIRRSKPHTNGFEYWKLKDMIY